MFLKDNLTETIDFQKCYYRLANTVSWFLKYSNYILRRVNLSNDKYKFDNYGKK